MWERLNSEEISSLTNQFWLQTESPGPWAIPVPVCFFIIRRYFTPAVLPFLVLQKSAEPMALTKKQRRGSWLTASRISGAIPEL